VGTLASLAEIGVCSKHRGRFCGGPREYHARENFDIVAYMQNPSIWWILAGKWFAMPPIMGF